MNSKITLLCLLLLAAFFGNGQGVLNDSQPHGLYLKVKKNAFKATQNSHNVVISSELSFLSAVPGAAIKSAKRPFFSLKEKGNNRVYSVFFSDKNEAMAVLQALKDNPSVELVELIPERKIISANDPMFASQWHLTKIQAPDAWNVSIPAGTATVAIVDNAFQVNHPDLAANMLAGYDVSDNDTDPSPPNTSFGHGTHVAGIVSAVTNNSIGIAAAANNRVKIMPIKATPDAGSANGIYDGYEGIAWAISHGADVISLSWGGAGYSQVEQDVINEAYTNNILVVAAAGNDNDEELNYPAAYNHVVSVASVTNQDVKSSFSSYGSTVDISAPGSGILSTIPFDAYESYSGTSMATPLVASVCGYVLSAYPTMTPDELEALIKRTSDDISALNPNYANKLGAGRINMLKAVACRSTAISQAQLTSLSDPYLCPGQSTTLQVSVPNLTYTWYKNNQPIANAGQQQLSVSQAGTYSVQVANGSCVFTSNSLLVGTNSVKTSPPTFNYVENTYCTAAQNIQKLVAQAANCAISGPATFTYTGPQVGFDGNEKSGDFPTANVSGLGGKLTTLEIEIVWEKKDVFSYDNCGTTDAGGAAYYDEVSFGVMSPTGKFQYLVTGGTYSGGFNSFGVLTTRFVTGGAALSGTPASGTFQPTGDLTQFFGENPNGTWTLIANDDSFVDPLCVKSFSVKVETDAPDTPPVITWWSSANGTQVLGTGYEYTPDITVLGEREVYVSAKCVGGCESERKKAKHFVRTLPYLRAYPINDVFPDDYPTNVSVEKITQSNELTGFKLSYNDNTLADQTYDYIPPQESPVTVCQRRCFVILAADCPGNTVQWSFGLKGESRIVCTSGGLSFTATCLQSYPCPFVTSNVMEIVNGLQNLTIERRLEPRSDQQYYSNRLTSRHYIAAPATVNYHALKSIQLLPGFEVTGDKQFQAVIAGCPQ